MKVEKLKCYPVLGFNTKQWWIYEKINDVYIDIPTVVLNELKECSDTTEQENKLEDIVGANPDWLYDKEYWYDGDMDI